jgi:hypothetical protein
MELEDFIYVIIKINYYARKEVINYITFIFNTSSYVNKTSLCSARNGSF